MAIEAYGGKRPQLGEQSFVHESAVLIGEVHIGRRASIWPCAVLRGDQGAIEIGAETSIQDGTIIHATHGVSSTSIGARVTVGHRVILHGCTVEDDVLVGMGSILLDNCRIGRWSIIGAGALVPIGARIPERSLVLGLPGRVVRQVTDHEIEHSIKHGREEYLRLCAEYAGWSFEEEKR